LAIAERADLVVLVDVLGGGLLLSRGRETVQLAPGQVAAVEVALVALPNFTIRAPEQVTGQLSRAGTADVTLTCDLTSTLTNTGIATLLAQRATFTLLDLATGALLAGPTSDGIGVWGTGPFAPSGGPHEAIQRYTWTDQDRAAGFEAQYDLTMVATGDSAMDEATASYTVRCEPPPAIRDMSGVWTGLYAWDCGGDGSRTGSAAVSLELIQEGTSLSGVIRYRGGSAPVTGVRLSDVEFGEFGSRTGIPDPSGLGVALSWPTSSPYFVNNALWGFLGDTGAEVGALALNGDSPAGESAGCSAPSNSSGSFDLQRPSAAAER
jgi:hypothetical protein